MIEDDRIDSLAVLLRCLFLAADISVGTARE
jgi:hypothetical protein